MKRRRTAACERCEDSGEVRLPLGGGESKAVPCDCQGGSEREQDDEWTERLWRDVVMGG